MGKLEFGVPSKRRKLKAAVMAGSIICASAAILTSTLAKDQSGLAFSLTLASGATLIGLSAALQFLYQRMQRSEEHLDIALSLEGQHTSIASIAPLMSWVDVHLAEVRRGMLAILDREIEWQTAPRTQGFNAGDPEGWRRD